MQMKDSFSNSIAPGTAANRLTQAKSFLSFAVYYKVPVLHPSVTQLCMYAQLLSNTYPAPSTIRNYISGAKTWIQEHGGNISAFSAPECLQLVKSIQKKSQHIPSRAEPLFWEHIRIVVDFINSNPCVPLSAKPCILIGFHTFLRGSNLVSPSTGVWAGPHSLLAKHVRVSDLGLHVSVHTTKTKLDRKPVTAVLPWNNDPVYCPVQAWLRYATARRPCPIGPAFVTDNHLPLTPRHIIGIMKLALQNIPGINAEKITMHSLRRGAVQDAKRAGVPVEQLMVRGMWRSRSGIRPYLN